MVNKRIVISLLAVAALLSLLAFVMPASSWISARPEYKDTGADTEYAPAGYNSWYGEENVYTCRVNEDKMIALTFDDGPHPVYTDKILDILERYGIKATFFVIGVNCRAYPEQLKREVAAGHEIGNHTYNHPRLSKVKQKELVEELNKTEAVIAEISGSKPVLFRPPEGRYADNVKKASEKMKYKTIIWSLDTEDWKHPPAEKIAAAVTKNVKSGDIILCHDYVSPRSNTVKALEIFIPELISRGYKFVTVSELIGNN